jgi:hypothetical protein
MEWIRDKPKLIAQEFRGIRSEMRKAEGGFVLRIAPFSLIFWSALTYGLSMLSSSFQSIEITSKFHHLFLLGRGPE